MAALLDTIIICKRLVQTAAALKRLLWQPTRQTPKVSVGIHSPLSKLFLLCTIVRFNHALVFDFIIILITHQMVGDTLLGAFNSSNTYGVCLSTFKFIQVKNRKSRYIVSFSLSCCYRMHFKKPSAHTPTSATTKTSLFLFSVIRNQTR